MPFRLYDPFVREVKLQHLFTLLKFIMLLSVLGSNLNRLIYNNMTYNSAEKSLKMDFAIPEAGIEYKWRLQPPISPGSGFEIMDFLWMQNWPYVGFFIKVWHTLSWTSIEKEGIEFTL